MEPQPYYNPAGPGFPGAEAEYEPLHRYTAKTFGWMFLGLFTTLMVALAGYITGTVVLVYSIPYAPFILLLAELGVVLFLSARIQKMSVLTARILFFAYAALNGIVFSMYFFMFQMLSLVFIFAMTALYFGLMALYGYMTKTDLSKFRNILLGGLIFLALFWVVGMFINLSSMELIISFVGVIIFLGLTAYDTQKIKAYHAAYAGNPEMAAKASIFSALQLYLDFINLFLYLLRILGKRR